MRPTKLSRQVQMVRLRPTLVIFILYPVVCCKRWQCLPVADGISPVGQSPLDFGFCCFQSSDASALLLADQNRLRIMPLRPLLMDVLSDCGTNRHRHVHFPPKLQSQVDVLLHKAQCESRSFCIPGQKTFEYFQTRAFFRPHHSASPPIGIKDP
jgi:hypothetical protein